MPLGQPQGRPLRANAVASLAGTGHLSPAGRRPVGGAVQHAHLPGPASRPGPRSLSARQVAAVNAQNARIRREVEQTIAECKRAVAASNRQQVRRAQSLTFSQYDFDKRSGGRDAEHVAFQLPGTYREVEATRYRTGALWIYATSLHNGWGDHQYFIYNPETGAILQFTPEASIKDPKKQLYQSKQTRIQGTAAGTGIAGGYLEKGFLGTGAVFMTGGMALELGAYAFVVEEVAPVVSRVAVQAYRIAQPAAKRYVQYAAKGALTRMGVDFGFQYGTSYLTANPDKGSRAQQAIRSVNGTQVVAAGVIVAGKEASTAAKFLLALGNAAATNLVTFNRNNKNTYNSYWHVVDFSNAEQRVEYIRNVIIGALVDPVKEKTAGLLTGKLTGKVEEWAAQTSGRASQAALKWLTESRVEMAAGVVLGSMVEIPKKLWERSQAEQEEDKKKAAALRHPARASTPTKPRK